MKNAVDTGIELREVSSSTPGLSSRRLTFTEIPIVDLSPMFSDEVAGKQQLAKDLLRACTEIGFFYIKNHGVSNLTVDKLLDASRDFFAKSETAKMEIDISKSSFSRGYIPMYGEKNNATAKGDVKETFDMGIDIAKDDPDFQSGNPLYGPNQWPADMPEFKTSMNDYFAEVTQLSHVLYKAFALSLDLSENYFLGSLNKPLDILRLLRYPPQPVVEDESQIGTGAHSDFDCFTILWQDNNGGLQALNSEGVWVDATPIPDTFLINVGDMMERWTNGLFVSTVHRVINKSGNERYSVVFFASPDYSTSLECLPSCFSDDQPARYEPVSAGDYIVSRYNEILV